jgi:hypothetical protein
MLVKELVNTNSDPRLNFFLAPHDNFAFHRAYSMKLQVNFIPLLRFYFLKLALLFFFLIYIMMKKNLLLCQLGGVVD